MGNTWMSKNGINYADCVHWFAILAMLLEVHTFGLRAIPVNTRYRNNITRSDSWYCRFACWYTHIYIYVYKYYIYTRVCILYIYTHALFVLVLVVVAAAAACCCRCFLLWQIFMSVYSLNKLQQAQGLRCALCRPPCQSTWHCVIWRPPFTPNIYCRPAMIGKSFLGFLFLRFLHGFFFVLFATQECTRQPPGICKTCDRASADKKSNRVLAQR